MRTVILIDFYINILNLSNVLKLKSYNKFRAIFSIIANTFSVKSDFKKSFSFLHQLKNNELFVYIYLHIKQNLIISLQKPPINTNFRIEFTI